MGDIRYGPYYTRVREARDRSAAVRALTDEGVVSALAAASTHRDPYLSNVLATEAMNRIRRLRNARAEILRADDASASTRATLDEAVASARPGQHLCLVYETEAEQFAAVVPFVRGGLERGERAVYVAHGASTARVRAALRAGGVDVESATRDGALLVVSTRDAYLAGGTFDPDRMVAYLSNVEAESRALGFAGVRVAGEMTWALGSEPGVERLVEYEARLNDHFPRWKMTALCQYDRARFPPDVLEQIVFAHPQIVHGGLVCENVYYVPPDRLLHPDGGSERVSRLLSSLLAREQSESALHALNRELERRVAERTAELERANRELEAFSYSVSHDLRAPLRGIDFFSEVLAQDYGDRLDAQGRDYLARVRGESRRLTTLVNDLLALSRIARGEVSRESVDLAEVARSVAEALSAAYPDRNVTLVLESPLPAVGDARLLRVVLENLMGNAWKFTRESPSPRVEVGVVEADGEPHFFVRDNGAGFDMTEAHRLFQPFQRLHAAGEFEGTGIGLATVARVVQRHGGRVWAEGERGVGATFWFTL